MEPRITLITLGVRDLARAKRFYEAIGFSISERGDETIAFIDAGGVALGLYGWDALAEDAAASAEGAGFRGVAIAHNVKSKDEVAQVLAEAAQAGARIVKPGQDAPWGGHSGYFADPDGHLWEVAYSDAWKFQPDGALVIE